MQIILDVLEVFGLILCLCSVALIVIRCMGNRTVGQLSPFDFVIMVGTGDIIVTTAMDQNQSILAGVGGLIALLVLQQILSYVSLKSTFWRKIFEGVPVVLIRNGELIRENFQKTRFNYDDLRQELHKLGMDMTEVKNIKLARLESCGVFSVIKANDLEPLTKRDIEMYLQKMYEDPLSKEGRVWAKFSRMIEEIHAAIMDERKKANEKEQ